MSDLFAERRAKRQAFLDEGTDPYPRSFADRVATAEARGLVDREPPAAVAVAGRVVRRRDFGKMVFVDLVDQSGTMQILVQKAEVTPEEHKLVRRRIDEGDFLGVCGTMGRSKTGEVTVFATQVQLLSKSLRPLPEKWHGLQDVDLRTRYRYLDLVANPEVRDAFVMRSRIIQDMRRWLQDRDFLEVETPILHPIAGGAAARPFHTHHNALDLSLFLRIAPELYLKRLLVGGFEKVFEIGRVFRNEGISTRHNPEFTMLELYQAYVGYEAVMDLTEELIVELARTHCENSQSTIGEQTVDLSGPFRRAPYRDLVREHAGIDPTDPAAVQAKAAELRLDVKDLPPGKVLDEVFEATVLPHLTQPTFVTYYPTELSPLAKTDAEDPSVCERFELFMNGWEVANAFSELNDPVDQRQRFEDQVASRDPESMAEVDEDYLRALEHGMPPAAGLGIGIDRLIMVLGGFPSIRDTILFPLRRPTAEDRAGDDEQESEATG